MLLYMLILTDILVENDPQTSQSERIPGLADNLDDFR